MYTFVLMILIILFWWSIKYYASELSVAEETQFEVYETIEA